MNVISRVGVDLAKQGVVQKGAILGRTNRPRPAACSNDKLAK